MKTIEIDDFVWQQLQERAVPFEDTPNDVLRRLLAIELEVESPSAVLRSPVDSRQGASPDFTRTESGSEEADLESDTKYNEVLAQAEKRLAELRELQKEAPNPSGLSRETHLRDEMPENLSLRSFKERTSRMSAKARGNLNRNRYFKTLSRLEITMARVRGVVYRSQTGATAAIPSATERSPGKWFLGVAASLFDEFSALNLILLCEKKDELLDFVLPRRKLKTIFGDLTQDSNNQLKFNIAEASIGHYALSIPSMGTFDLTPFLGRRDILKERMEPRAPEVVTSAGAYSTQGKTSMQGTATSEVCVYKTDPKWIDFLKASGRADNVNFWRRPDKTFHDLPGTSLYFLLRGTDQMVGRGILRKFARMSSLAAWSRFDVGNGAPSQAKFLALIGETLGIPKPEEARIGCLILDQVEWLNVPLPFHHDRGTWTFTHKYGNELREIIDAFD